ncbi:MAG TPA: 3-deoxy-D-manno-octulosonic acid transferase [Candidatus Acidoferrales bacterium]|nr:3-deoxy-D-manno-octulosonic acid transferase [Candidatus Acidoferrales bacterium]
MYLLYSIVTAIGMVLLAPYFVLQGLRRGKYLWNVRERMGYLPEALARNVQPHTSIWVHAVSVGEVLASQPVVDGLKEQFPECAVFLSTTTITGQELARERIRRADRVFYFPFDWPLPVRRAFERIQPRLVVILETEIWPNFLREARRAGVPVVFVNSRISERSVRRFRRFQRFVDGFFRRVLENASFFLAQSEQDAERLKEMGASAEKIEVTGNLKYDIEPPAQSVFGTWLAEQIASQERWPVFVAGSVVAGEEEAVLAAYDIVQRQWRRALLILAPRKPERFDVASELATQSGWTVVRRSTVDMNVPLDENCDVLILDSIGELAGLYALGDGVFVGGSLVPSGGHNILEPAWFCKVPIFGPSMENFREIAARFSGAGAGIQVRTGDRLGNAWAELIADSSRREQMGQKARALVEANRGATARSLERIARILESQRGDA